jgi:hypothetical protein
MIKYTLSTAGLLLAFSEIMMEIVVFYDDKLLKYKLSNFGIKIFYF